ncbi:MAG TPA: TonB-dependent receptor [Woeseiaceae bacterium]|nr:TonB-dependent receptor [Woeseiaceae bacterium]
MPVTPSFACRAVLLLALLSFGGLAQADALVQGQVTDAVTERPLPSANVRLVELDRTATTTPGGEFSMFGVPPGQYTLQVRYIGYRPEERTITVPESGAITETVALAAVGEQIVVTGYRASQASSLMDKRMSDIIKESVTADDAGKLPDQNAAEALRRVTGVTSTVDQGEGRYVTVRGVDPSYTNVTLNGNVIGSPEDTRRVSLDTIPSEVMSKIEVVKSVTPDMDGNAVGGSINIETPSAFNDPDGSFFSTTADVGYYDMNGKYPTRVALAWGQVFGPEEQWGVVLSGSYSDRNYASENLQGGDPWEEEGAFFIPDSLVLRDYRIERVRKGIVANLEYRPNARLKLYLNNLYNEFEDTEVQGESVWDYRNGDLLNQTATSGLFTEGEGERLMSERVETQIIQTSTLGGEYLLDNWILDASFTYGKARQETPTDREWSFELAEAIPMTYDTSDLFFDVNAGPEFHDPSMYEFNEYNRGGQLIDGENTAIEINLQRQMDWGGHSGYLKFGAKRMTRDKDSDQDLTVFDGFADDLTLTGFTLPGKEDFYSSVRPYYDFGFRIDYDAIESFFTDNSAGFEASAADTVAESFGSDFDVSEDVSAAYLMGVVDIGRATFTGGVRVERTEAEYSAFNILFEDGDALPPTRVTGGDDYTNWLPGLQMRLQVKDDLIVRAAWTNTIGRPSFDVAVPFRIFEVEEDDPGVFEGEIEAGNADLQALESMNLDLAVEWYLESAGLVSAGVFYKDIEHPIFTRFIELEDETFEGRFFNELVIETTDNAESGEILGLELNYQQQFRALPEPFNGFGVALNYTWSDSEATVFDREEKVPFFLQSDGIGNAAFFYERSGFEARLAFTYYSRYLDALAADPSQDVYIDARGQLDFKTSYAFTDHVSAFFDWENITDEPLRFFSGDNEVLLAENEFYGWNMSAGVQLQF